MHLDHGHMLATTLRIRRWYLLWASIGESDAVTTAQHTNRIVVLTVIWSDVHINECVEEHHSRSVGRDLNGEHFPRLTERVIQNIYLYTTFQRHIDRGLKCQCLIQWKVVTKSCRTGRVFFMEVEYLR